MSGLCFVDTNVLIYRRDSSEPDKQARSYEWLTELWSRHLGRTSVQVLNEYYVTVTRKLTPGLGVEEAWRDITDLFSWKPVAMDIRSLEVAREVQQDFGFSWWDSLIVASAKSSGSSFLVSEDFQDSQNLHGLMVVNPFRHDPAQVLVGPP